MSAQTLERAPHAVITNGEGNHCTSHLNLTVTLADPVRVEAARHDIAATMSAKRRYERQPKIPYAGKDQ